MELSAALCVFVIFSQWIFPKLYVELSVIVNGRLVLKKSMLVKIGV